MDPRLTHSLAALRAAFDQLSPGRDRSSDGWIGDTTHQARTSGHNPDDMRGSRAEYSDADTTPEVRALDVDADLRHPSVTMADAIGRILATPEDRRRLRYVIYDRRICSATSDWQWRPYTGDNPHTRHAHFSGNPDYDDDGRPWSVATMGGTMLTDRQDSELHAMWSAVFFGGSSCGPAVPVEYRVDPDRSRGNAVVDKLAYLVDLATSTTQRLDAILSVLSTQADGTSARLEAIQQAITHAVDDIAARLSGVDLGELADALAAAGVDLDALADVILGRRTTASVDS